MRIAIYIPAYNAASTIPKVLNRIPADLKQQVEEIFVVDNASEDNTHLVAIGYGHVNELPTLKVFRNSAISATAAARSSPTVTASSAASTWW